MNYIEIDGSNRLKGKIKVSGFKNSALPILYATILLKDVCVLYNIPEISDVKTTMDILKHMGAKVTRIAKNTYEIDTRDVGFGEAPQELVRSMRGSYYLLGAELGRFRRAKIGEIGGCNFGIRPIDQHIKVFRALGATVNYTPTMFVICAEKLTANRINFDVISVGATINAIISACTCEGRTVLFNAAKEPHVVDLANFLNKCGAKISGAGTNKIIIDGVKKLHGCEYRIISDIIEAETYMAIGAVIGDGIEIEGVCPAHIGAVFTKLTEAGIKMKISDNVVAVYPSELRAVEVKTAEYPGFPTDMQPQFTAIMTQAKGVSKIYENVWRSRFRYVEELIKMGADISVNGDVATVNGGAKLHGAQIETTDLRAGAALIISALCAEGRSLISYSELVMRGYENICEKLRGLGAHIREIDGNYL